MPSDNIFREMICALHCIRHYALGVCDEVSLLHIYGLNYAIVYNIISFRCLCYYKIEEHDCEDQYHYEPYDPEYYYILFIIHVLNQVNNCEVAHGNPEHVDHIADQHVQLTLVYVGRIITDPTGFLFIKEDQAVAIWPVDISDAQNSQDFSEEYQDNYEESHESLEFPYHRGQHRYQGG